MLKFEECKKILNKNDEYYTDDEIKSIMNLIDHWARINAKTISKKLILNEEKGSSNGTRKFG